MLGPYTAAMNELQSAILQCEDKARPDWATEFRVQPTGFDVRIWANGHSLDGPTCARTLTWREVAESGNLRETINEFFNRLLEEIIAFDKRHEDKSVRYAQGYSMGMGKTRWLAHQKQFFKRYGREMTTLEKRLATGTAANYAWKAGTGPRFDTTEHQLGRYNAKGMFDKREWLATPDPRTATDKEVWNPDHWGAGLQQSHLRAKEKGEPLTATEIVQAKDRIHRNHQTPVEIKTVHVGTKEMIDERVLEALARKFEVANGHAPGDAFDPEAKSVHYPDGTKLDKASMEEFVKALNAGKVFGDCEVIDVQGVTKTVTKEDPHAYAMRRTAAGGIAYAGGVNLKEHTEAMSRQMGAAFEPDRVELKMMQNNRAILEEDERKKERKEQDDWFSILHQVCGRK